MQHRPERELRRSAVTAGLCVLLYFAILLLQNQAPLTFLYLVAEDWWGEYGTAVAYLTAGGLVLAAMKLAPHRRTAGHLVMALGFFFIAMEEISWAQRLLGIRTPHVVSQFNYQSEINLHNSVPVDFMTWFCYGVIAWLALSLVASLNGTVARFMHALGVPAVRWSRVPPFVLALMFLLPGRLEHDEIGELILAFAFLYWAAGAYLVAHNESPRRRIAPLVFAGAVVVLVAGVTAALVAVGADEDSYRFSVRHSAMVAFPSEGYYEQAAMLFRHMISRPGNPMYDDALFEYAMFLNRIQHPDARTVLQQFLQQRYGSPGDDVHDDEHRRAGVAFKLLDDQENARRAFQRALDGATRRLQRAPQQSKSGPLFSLAKTYLELGEVGLALKHAHEARDLAQSSRDRFTIQDWVENNIERRSGA